ncbi:MAG: RDD family protein [Bacilli bacterium]
MNEEIASAEIEVIPARFGRRILSFLADIFIMLIASVFLFELVVFQITKPIIGYYEKIAQRSTINLERLDLLYDNGLIIKTYNNEGNLDYNFDKGSEAAFASFMKFYVYKEGDITNISYTRNNNDEVVARYNINVNYAHKMTLTEINKAYITSIQNNDIFVKENNEFIRDKEGYLVLSKTNKNLLKPYFDAKDKISSSGEKLLSYFRNGFFFSHYDKIINDFASGNATYKNITKQINEITYFVDSSTVYATLASYFLAVGVFYFLIPLLDKKGRTLGKIFLKLEVIEKNTVVPVAKSKVVWRGAIEFFENLPIVAFIPMLSVGFSYCFSLYLINIQSFKISLLFVIIFGMVFDAITLIISLSNSKKMSIKELASNSVVVESSLVDAYNREKEIKWELEK